MESRGGSFLGHAEDYRMSESDVQSTTGLDLVESMLAAYGEVAPAMNLCMQIELADQLPSRNGPRR